MPQAATKLRPLCNSHRPAALGKLDRRTWQARLLADTRAELSRHAGGKPSATERVLIERAAALTVHVAHFDRTALEGGGMSDHAARQYLAFSNSLSRVMRALGIKGVPERPLTMAELLASERAKAAA